MIEMSDKSRKSKNNLGYINALCFYNGAYVTYRDDIERLIRAAVMFSNNLPLSEYLTSKTSYNIASKHSETVYDGLIAIYNGLAPSPVAVTTPKAIITPDSRVSVAAGGGNAPVVVEETAVAAVTVAVPIEGETGTVTATVPVTVTDDGTAIAATMPVATAEGTIRAPTTIPIALAGGGGNLPSNFVGEPIENRPRNRVAGGGGLPTVGTARKTAKKPSNSGKSLGSKQKLYKLAKRATQKFMKEHRNKK